MQSGDEPAASSDPGSTAFGTDLSSRLRASPLSSGPGDTELPAGSSDPELGPLSPELALVDPELARAARKLLPDGPRAVPVEYHPAAASVTEPATVKVDLRVGLEPIPDVGRPRRRVWLGWVPTAAGFIVLGAVLTLLVRNEWRLLPREEPQSAGATSPPLAARTEPLPATTAAPPAATATEPALTATAPAPAPTTTPPASTAPPPAKPATKPAPTATTKKPATTAASPAPTRRTPVAPSPGPVAASGQTFAWAAAPSAAAYEFQLFRGGERIFRKRVDEPRLELAGRWRQGGRSYTLAPGRYRWYVWTISRLTKRQSKVATVQATLVVERQPQ